MDICARSLLKALNKDWSEARLSYREKDKNFLYSGIPGDGPYAYERFAIRQLKASIFKKFEDEIDLKATTDTAFEKFTASNVACGSWALDSNRSMEDDLLLSLTREKLYKFFMEPSGSILSDPNELFHQGSFGPGASVGANGTDFYTKVGAGVLTATNPSLFRVYDHCVQNVPNWNQAEKARFSEFGDVKVVEGNRLCFVPKNVNTARAICVEPSLNMFFQQGIRAILEGRLRSVFNIDLANQQEVNRELARIGSKDDSLCTIDLASASDSMALSMMQYMLPPDVFKVLVWCRSSAATYTRTDPKGQAWEGWTQLRMLSTMGNAFTFPLQTILFACVISAVYTAQEIELVKYQSGLFKKLEGKLRRVCDYHLPNFGVFGDDIIVEKQAYRQTVRLLNLLGFTVNAEKSFNQGPFRESCGADFFWGRPVRGVYIKSLKTMGSRYVAINRLNAWSAMTGITLSRTVQLLVKSVRYLPIPLYENDDAGIKVPRSMIQHQLRLDSNHSVLYKRWEGTPKKIKIKDGYLKMPKGYSARFYNEAGLLLAALRGDVRGFEFGSRLGPAHFRPKQAVSPNWDALPPVATKDGGYSKSRLESAIYLNLNS